MPPRRSERRRVESDSRGGAEANDDDDDKRTRVDDDSGSTGGAGAAAGGTRRTREDEVVREDTVNTSAGQNVPPRRSKRLRVDLSDDQHGASRVGGDPSREHAPPPPLPPPPPEAEAAAASEAAAAAAVAADDGVRDGSSDEVEGTCIICLSDERPWPIQSGCACRGDAGLAHVECRAEAAHHMESSGAYHGWSVCGTCGQAFTGVMQLKLACAWMMLTAGRFPPHGVLDVEWLAVLAASTACAGVALLQASEYDGAVSLLRDAVDMHRIMLVDPENQQRLSASTNLACALFKQGEIAEAETMSRETLEVQRRVLGSEHRDTLSAMINLGAVLQFRGKNGEAEAMFREVLAVGMQVLGPEHPAMLAATMNLARTLAEQGKHVEAEKMYRETLAIQRRVLGPDHPSTKQTAANLAECVCSSTANSVSGAGSGAAT
jgi:tetratricopeptide (TPR) repeat protein